MTLGRITARGISAGPGLSIPLAVPAALAPIADANLVALRNKGASGDTLITIVAAPEAHTKGWELLSRIRH